MGWRVFITVAEVSGDKHAAQLIRSLRELEPGIRIEGLGGPEMEAAGAIVHQNTVVRAAMGWRGILRGPEIYQLIRWTTDYFEQYQPDLQIGVDSPSMNIRFAKIAHSRGVPALQYVAPQLWAWAPWRMKSFRRWVDRIACILPFEESYFRAHGVAATFVGHPLFDELPVGRGTGDSFSRDNPPLTVGLLAGSRKSEAEANFPGMLQVAERIRAVFPDAAFLAPTTAATHPIVKGLLEAEEQRAGRAEVQELPPPAGQGAAERAPIKIPPRSFTFGVDRFDEMVPRCDLCLTVSGTATLHVAAFGIPMIVVYRTNPILWKAAGRWIVPARTFALVNLLAKETSAVNAAGPGGHIVPEFVPWLGPADTVADLAVDLLSHREKLEAQRSRLLKLVRSLDHPGASMNVARLAIRMMDARNKEESGK